MRGFETLTGKEHELLERKCQENDWLMRGGVAWQDDPYLEEYPYAFSRTESVESLREAFAQGNWSIRQGFVFKDLAFIQQEDGGDEWWTCKRFGDEWVNFESCNFGSMAKDPSAFESTIAHMCNATREQCAFGDYMESEVPEGGFGLSSKIQAARAASEAATGERGVQAEMRRER